VGETKTPSLQVSPVLTAPLLRALHRAEHIGSALKGGVNVCQRQLVNEVLGPLVTELVPNFDREDAQVVIFAVVALLLGVLLLSLAVWFWG